MKPTRTVVMLGALIGAGCAEPYYKTAAIPAREYADNVRAQYTSRNVAYPGTAQRPGEVRGVPAIVAAEARDQHRARLRFASDERPLEEAPAAGIEGSNQADPQFPPDGGFVMKRSSMTNTREYTGPLTLGNPGVTASLWQESRSNSDLFHDTRAWQPMDLLTIVVSEQAEGANNANTEIKSKSTVEAAISKLLGLETNIVNNSKQLTEGVAVPGSLVSATAQNDYKGEGKTDRKGSLKGKISAMVAEVLPSGVLRIEGEKIVSVNSEQQVMVISGLVRPRDISSENEVDSSKIAQLRVDYYGEGTVGEAQSGGWLGRFMRTVWPF